MCEKLLQVLGSVKPGVEVKVMTWKHTVTVKLMYAPFASGLGSDLEEATKACVLTLLEIVEGFSEQYKHLLPMLKELYEVL